MAVQDRQIAIRKGQAGGPRRAPIGNRGGLKLPLSPFARRRITPRKRPQSNLKVPHSVRPSGNVGTDTERAEVSYRLLNADTDPDLRKLLPVPIADVGFELGTGSVRTFSTVASVKSEVESIKDPTSVWE